MAIHRDRCTSTPGCWEYKLIDSTPSPLPSPLKQNTQTKKKKTQRQTPSLHKTQTPILLHNFFPQPIHDLLKAWLHRKLQRAHHSQVPLLDPELEGGHLGRCLHRLGCPLPKRPRLPVPVHWVPFAGWQPAVAQVALRRDVLDVVGEGRLVGFGL